MQAAVDGHKPANWALVVMRAGAADRSVTSNPLREKNGAALVVRRKSRRSPCRRALATM